MATLSSQVSIPTLEKLNVKLPEDIDARQVAATWLKAFSKATSSSDVEGVVALVLEDGLWRDMLALTWDFRTLHGASRIHKFLKARLAESKITAIRLAEDGARAPSLFTAIPGMVWVQGLFDFETVVGVGSGVFRIVPALNGQWKAHVIYTNLESLHGVPSKVGPLRNPKPYHGQWLERRAKEVAFEDADPKVLIIGSGQSGLAVAARLKYSDVPSLVVERNPRVGDSWRNRYEALCLHDPVCKNCLPTCKCC